MRWTCYISRLDRIWEAFPTVLPRCAFVLTDGVTTRSLSGWLPCHHNNVSYILDINEKNIQQIVDITLRAKRRDDEAIRSALKRFKKYKIEHWDQYKRLATEAYVSKALWSLSLVYPLWTLQTLDLLTTYDTLLPNLLQLCDRESPLSNPKWWYDYPKALDRLQRLARIAKQDLPWDELEAQMEFQLQLRFDTGIKRRPKTLTNIQKYKGLWTTNAEIRRVRLFQESFKDVQLQLGSPCPSQIPTEATCLCANDEDIFRWHCCVEQGTMYTVATCPPLENTTVYIGFAHLWGVEQWAVLASKLTNCPLVCIGRLDQYPRGRGQLFCDMYDSGKFPCTPVYHHATDNVLMVETDNVETFVQEIRQKHRILQCFAENPHQWENIDTGRVCIRGNTGWKIRTLREQGQGLYEEKCHRPVGRNASVLRVTNYSGLPVPYSIYICSAETRPFHVHVARTHTRHLLYVVNCSTCLFSFEKTAPQRTTINPFTT